MTRNEKREKYRAPGMRAVSKPGKKHDTGLVAKVAGTIVQYEMLEGGESVLVGLSGGPDSVCLLHMLHRLKERFGIALHAVYVDHNLRPDETPVERDFCCGLCEGFGVEFSVRTIDVLAYAKEKGLNKQEAARQLRYAAFEEAALAMKAGRIALGHNADDQIETVLMRLLRGTGPRGLSGMPAKRGMIIRPLIGVERTEVERFLAGDNIPFVVDSSNLGTDYFRNRIRRDLVPVMRQLNPSLAGTVADTVSILQEEERYFNLAVTKALMRMISRKTAHRIELFLSPMEIMDKAILRRVLRRALEETDSLRGMSFTHIEDIIDLVKHGSAGARLSLPRDIRAIKEYAVLVITSEKPVRIDEYTLTPPAEVAVRGAGLVIRAALRDDAGDSGDGRSSVILDAEAMQFPLTVRPRAEGDFFLPMGFGKRKKLQDFFVDARVPRDERDSVPVVVSGSDIVWIAGYRADERFRVKEDTTKFLQLSIVKGKC
jgi:tRNA(Ile)-lysidine synthase